MIAIITSVTTWKTNRFTTPLGNFDYHRVKPDVFGFGYVLDEMDAYRSEGNDSRKIMIATPQKAILDFFCINSFYRSKKKGHGRPEIE